MVKERIQKLVFEKSVSFDGASHFIFRTEEGERRIFEATGYESFRLQPGLSLFARTRKKGCAGEEITELMHPAYMLGVTYPFRIVRTGSFRFNNEEIHFVVVSDDDGDEYKIKVAAKQDLLPGDPVNCCLKEQTKGKLKFSIQ